MVSCALVKRRPRKFGIGLVLRQITSFSIQKPMSCSLVPTRKMLWYEPMTQIVPSSLRMRRAAFSHASVKRS